MKKIIFVLLMSAILTFATACGNESNTDAVKSRTAPISETTSEDHAAVPAEASAEEAAGYVCVFDNGVTIEMGAPADAVIADLGEPLNYAEAPSCIHEGMDKVYTFDGYTVTSSPDADGSNRIYEVSLLSDVVALEGGLTIGSSMDKVVSMFGEEYTEQFGVLQYALDDVNVSVVLDGDSYVTSLVITANME